VKICLATRCFDFRNAGLGRVSSEIRKELEQRGYNPYCIASDASRGLSLSSYFWYTAWNIRRQLPKDYNVYHALTPMEAIWTPKEKTIVTFHDLFTLTDPSKVGGGLGYNNYKRTFGAKYFRWACRKAIQSHFIVCVSEKTKKEVCQMFDLPEDKVKVIHSGINADLKSMPKPDNIFRIGYLGGLDRRKRVNLLIDAFRKSDINAELVIGGTGLDEKILKSQAGDDKRIKFLGLIPDESLPSFYNSLSVFAFCSFVEGYGLPIIEAFACKKPVVILSDAKLPSEIYQRCYAVAKEDLDTVINLLPDTNIHEQIRVESNRLFARNHSWEKCVNEYVELYKEIVGEQKE
jgi:glycosyltransferase involved in cell wall biosynthesis